MLTITIILIILILIFWALIFIDEKFGSFSNFIDYIGMILEDKNNL